VVKSAINRREFLLKAAQAGLGLGLSSPLITLAGCGGSGGSTVTETPGGFDAIIVGGGAAGAIVAAKLQAASRGQKRILIIEAGGATSATIGGTDFPPWLPPNRTDLTILDVPGEYSLLAFQPAGAPFQLTETPFTWQGIGLGGNAMFNGMLFQTNPSEIFDQDWPAGWNAADMAPYFQRVRQNIPVTNTPSTDGIPQNTGPADIIHPLYAANGWVEGNTSMPIDGPGGLYSRPYVAATNGRRAGPISGYFEAVDPGGVPAPGLEILLFAKCDRIDFDSHGTAEAVNYRRRAGLDQSDPGVAGTARLKKGGVIVMAAGALVTPRLLLLSGVGPRGREAEFFPMRSSVPKFKIDNQAVGVGVFDHVMSMVTYSYDGAVPYEAYNYGNFAANASDLDAYLANGSGPYAQYQPVSILHYGLGRTTPNVEIFLNPNGAGPQGGPFYGPRTFSAFCMLLDPQARGLITLNDKDQVNFPDIYLPNTSAGDADTTLMAQAVFDMIQLFAQNPNLTIVFGPGSSSHPNLDPNSLADIRTYVTAPQPVDGVFYNKLIINHFGGTAALSGGPGGVDPGTLILRGTTNVAVVDASLIPTSVVGHPVGTIMAVADRAADILAARWT
jgi:cellobiose dehydrogenase (acceptor)